MSTATATPPRPKLDKEQIREACRAMGMTEVLSRLGVPTELLDPSREHPCPKCGGGTRARLVDVDAGAIRCSHCHHKSCGDIFATAQWLLGCDFPDALRHLAELTGCSAPAPTSKATSTAIVITTADDVMREVCKSKSMPVGAAKAFGAKATHWGSDWVLEFPTYGPDFKESSKYAIYADPNHPHHKGKLATGRGIPRMFMPSVDGHVRKPQKGACVFLLNSPKDAIAFESLGYTAYGLSKGVLDDRFAHWFDGVHVFYVPDLDKPGMEGAEGTAKVLKNSAASYTIVRLPGAITDSGGKDVRDFLKEEGGELIIREAIEKAMADASSSKHEIVSYSLPEFMGMDFHQEFLVEECVVSGQPGTVSAKSKSLKTTLSLDLILSIASGAPFLGKYQVPKPRPAGIISAESGGSTVQESLGRIARTKDVDPHAVAHLRIADRVPLLTNATGLLSIRKFIEDHKLECLVIDPTYKAFAGVDDANLSAMAEVLFPISDIIDETGCTIIFVHHHRKTPRTPNEHYAEPTMEDIAGTGFMQWSRFFLLVNKRREWDPDQGRHWLWFKTEGSAGFGTRQFLDIHEGKRTDLYGRVWECELSSPTEGAAKEREAADAEKEAKKVEGYRRKVCQVLAAHPEGLTKSAIATKGGINAKAFEWICEVMLDEGDIEPCDVTVSNQKKARPGYRLSGTDSTY